MRPRLPTYVPRLRALAVAVGLATLLTTCSASSDPSGGRPSSGAQAVAPNPREGPSASSPATPIVPVPLPPPPVRGTLPAIQRGMAVALYATDGPPEGLVTPSRALFERLAGLGVNAVTLNFPVFTGGPGSNDVFANSSQTPSEPQLSVVIRAAHDRHLAVILRPYLDEASLVPNYWRGSIQPRDRGAWFASYTGLLHEYAALAEREWAEGLVIGTEFNSLEEDQRWVPLVGDLRGAFAGRVGYSVNYNRPYLLNWAGVLDFVGVDAFFPLDVPVPATVAQLAAAWAGPAAGLRAARQALGKPLIVTEIGITSQSGSYLRPFVWDHGTLVDLEGQRRYYQASCEALSGAVDGLYWWNTPLDTRPDPNGFGPLGKPAEAEIGRCFSPPRASAAP